MPRDSVLRNMCLLSIVIFFYLMSSPDGYAAAESDATIKIYTSEKVGRINPDIYGTFMELVHDQFDGGIWAEMLRCRKFAENDIQDDAQLYGVVKSWYPIGRNRQTIPARASGRTNFISMPAKVITSGSILCKKT